MPAAKQRSHARAARKSSDPTRDLLRAILDRLDALADQSKRSMTVIEKDHAEEQRLTRLILRDHNRRITTLEQRSK
jgi:hypothetical protein